MRSNTPWPQAAALTLACAACCLGVPEVFAGAPLLGKPAPALVVTSLDGQELDLAKLRGHVVVLNLWASWCTPCRTEMPMLEAFHQQHLSDGVILLGLSADDPHDRRDVVKVMHEFSYSAALLQEARANEFGMPEVLPITYVIDAAGIIRAQLLPTRAGLSEPVLRAVVEPLLSTSTPAAVPPPSGGESRRESRLVE